ncbi:dTDP-4-dehydrorhamnose reductase [bacterium BMS3Abin15]|nr:dTDP-4-dehydrorhamnose reductase [bacterium BMS3Abin15]
MAKIRVLIVGSRGMLGQELVNTFKKDGDYKVTGWDKEEIDITSQKQVEQKIKKLSPNIIINAVAYNAVDKCEEDKKEFELAKKINGLAPGYLARATKKVGAVFIHYSSDYVFDGSPDIPEPAGCAGRCLSCELHKDFTPEIGFDEEAKPNPISNYGKSKLLGEVAAQKAGGKNYIIRLSKLFGKPAKSNDAKKSFFDVILEVGRKNKEVKVVDEETSCFTYAPDLAKKTKEIIESRKLSGIYHIVNSDPCTWYEAVIELYKQTKIKTKIIPVDADEFPRPAKRPHISTLINTKLNPLRSYKAALKDYLKDLE